MIALPNAVVTSLLVVLYVITARYQRSSFRGSALIALAFTGSMNSAIVNGSELRRLKQNSLAAAKFADNFLFQRRRNWRVIIYRRRRRTAALIHFYKSS